jgi:hypothetical protein
MLCRARATPTCDPPSSHGVPSATRRPRTCPILMLSPARRCPGAGRGGRAAHGARCALLCAARDPEEPGAHPVPVGHPVRCAGGRRPSYSPLGRNYSHLVQQSHCLTVAVLGPISLSFTPPEAGHGGWIWWRVSAAGAYRCIRRASVRSAVCRHGHRKKTRAPGYLGMQRGLLPLDSAGALQRSAASRPPPRPLLEYLACLQAPREWLRAGHQ